MSRPALPHQHANAQIRSLDKTALPPVKYQILTCQGQDILVGRMKIPTPTGSGHTFILRRFDTGAISLTTMFRAAFPEASELDEKRETIWVKENYDLSKNNGSSKENSIVRLAGIWISTTDALDIADAYSLSHIIQAMVKAAPDPTANYRRSGKGNTPKGAPVSPPASKATLPPATPTPAKRRKESSPQPAPASLRRSARAKSPAAAPMPSPLSPGRKGRPSKSAKAALKDGTARLPDSDDVFIDEDAEAVERMGNDMLKEDLAEQQNLIANLKAQRDTPKGEKAGKRGRAEAEEDYPKQLNFQEEEIGERAIATNRRVSRFQLQPRAKSFAWGVAAFAVGLGAVSMLPSFM